MQLITIMGRADGKVETRKADKCGILATDERRAPDNRPPSSLSGKQTTDDELGMERRGIEMVAGDTR